MRFASTHKTLYICVVPFSTALI